MEEQVISRAHRMGATRPIHVETLVMRETIEEQMVQFLQVCHIVLELLAMVMMLPWILTVMLLYALVFVIFPSVFVSLGCSFW